MSSEPGIYPRTRHSFRQYRRRRGDGDDSGDDGGGGGRWRLAVYPCQLAVFAVCVLVRVLNASLTWTFFQPDEYFQSLEVAHALVYGRGYLTWEWRHGIRSIAHPLVFAVPYALLKLAGLDSVGAKLFLPRCIQALFAATADLFTFMLAGRLFGREAAWFALFCTLTSFWNAYALTRTFSNSLETTVTVCAMYYWPWSAHARSSSHLFWALVLAAVACILRVTNFLIWFALGLNYLFRDFPISSAIILDATLVSVPAIAIMVGLDSWFYQRLINTPLNFLRFNLVHSLSSFYGTSHWNYYIVQAVPLLTLAQLPFTLLGWWRYRYTSVSGVIVFVVISYSLISHKEVRFLHPLVPLFVCFAGDTLSRMRPLRKRLAIIFILVINLSLAAYLNMVHQRGVMDAVSFLRNDKSMTSLMVLMPCHSTPWQSHLLRSDIDARFLTCEPPIDKSPEERLTYLDEADMFYNDPAAFTKQYLATNHPSHIIAFEQLQPVIGDLLEKHGYQPIQRYFNTHYISDSRRIGDVIVWKDYSTI